MSQRVSLDEDAIAQLRRESDHFGTSDLSKLIIAICSERRLLMQLCQRPQPQYELPKTNGSSNPELDELAALLE